MSLADCLRKAGKALSSRDATAIQTLADDFEASGMLRQEAELKAIEQHAGALQGEIDAMVPAELAQSAYHGTPHKFDKFSLEAIGTGEGAQAFGWGLYFAGDKEIANWYKEKLTLDLKNPFVRQMKATKQSRGAAAARADLEYDKRSLEAAIKESDDAIKALEQKYADNPTVQSMGIDAIWGELSLAERAVVEKSQTLPRDQLKLIDDALAAVDKEGQLYQVDIPEDGELLNLDVTIDKQSEKVKSVLQKIKDLIPESVHEEVMDRLNADWEDLTGREIYKMIEYAASEGAIDFPADVTVVDGNPDRVASLLLNHFGIPGSAYFDRTSRTGQEGTRNYVIWDESAVTVESVNDQMMQAEELMQSEGNLPRGTTLMNPDAPVISLSTASDMSTFLHETMHLFMLMEQQFAKEFGVTDNQRALLESVGVTSFEQLTREHHEQLAESFEVYLREGKAPSVKLMDAFNTFRAWLLQVYRSLKQLPNQKLDDKMRAAFDRLLATEEEIQQAAASPAFMQMFRTKEQAGMTDAEWAAYQEAKSKRDGRAITTIEQKIVNQLKQRKTKEWKQERDVLAREEEARLAELPVYKILTNTLKRTDDDMARPLDRKSIESILGVKNVTGAWIRRTSNDGTDPQLVSEAYGYETVEDMVQEMNEALPLQEAATEAAEARMKEKYGDILNDGTLEAEVMTALHNTKDVDKLYAELRALDSTQTLNRDLLKAEARRIIGTMKNSEIRPSKFHQNMIRAAQRAATSSSKAEKVLAKQQQLVNHYLYKEAVKAKKDADRFTAYVNKVKTRKYNTRQVAPDYVHTMKMLANLYTTKSKTTDADIKKLVEFYNGQEAAMTGITLLDPQLIVATEAVKRGDTVKPIMMKDMTMTELQGLYLSLKNLRFVGGRESEARAELRKQKMAALIGSVNEHGGKLSSDRITVVKDSVANMVNTDPKLKQIEKQVDALVKDIIKNGGTASPEAVAAFDKAAAKVGAPAADVVNKITGFATTGPAKGSKAQGDESKSGAKSLLATLPSLRNFLLQLDGGDDYGEAFKQIFMPVKAASNNKLKMHRQTYERFEKDLSKIDQVSLKRYGAKKIALDDGRVVRIHAEERFMTALYWGTESSRKKLKQGHKYTDADVMRILSGMSKPELELVNAVWKMNESVWPDAAKAHKDRTGVVPEKLAPTPFVVNGVELTGGHMRIYYRDDGIDADFSDAKTGEFESLVTSVSGTMFERVETDGKVILLDKGNITRALNDVIHYTAFANPSIELAAIMNDKAFRAAVTEKHGVEFLNGMIDVLRSTVTGKKDRDMYTTLARILRVLRRNQTVFHLMYSIRNFAQQITSLLPAMQEVGPVNFTKAALSFLVPGNKQAELINKYSEEMRNRAQLVNREAHEQLHNIAFGGRLTRANKVLNDYGFAMQTMMDSLVAYPVWQAKYESEMEKHGDHDIAVTIAETAVAQTVGSGLDLHQGAAFHTTRSEAVKGLTMFGSFFNSVMYQRYLRAKIKNGYLSKEMFMALAAQPILIGILSAMVTADIPEKEEDWVTWGLEKWGSQIAGMYPIIRDIFAFAQGFNKRGVVQGGTSAPTTIVKEVRELASDDGSWDDAAGLLRATGLVIPLPGGGQVARWFDYAESDDQNFLEGTVEGKQRNE